LLVSSNDYPYFTILKHAVLVSFYRCKPTYSRGSNSFIPIARLYLPRSKTPFLYSFIGSFSQLIRIKDRKVVSLVNSVISVEEVGLGYKESISRPCKPVVIWLPL